LHPHNLWDGARSAALSAWNAGWKKLNPEIAALWRRQTEVLAANRWKAA
jgi:hypothetical protein